MPRGQKSKLRAREKRRQCRAESQDLKTAQAAAGEEEEAASCSSSLLEAAASSSTGAGTLQATPTAPSPSYFAAAVSSERSAVKATGHVHNSKASLLFSHFPESSGLVILTQQVTVLVEYLLYQYKMKEPIKKSEMLKAAPKGYKKYFPEILRRAAEHMDLVYGLELVEIKPKKSYILVDNLGDIMDGSLRGFWRYPSKGILMPLLGVIFLNGNRASEEEIWEFLNVMDIYDGKSHFFFGEPRNLITKDLVHEEYLVYQQVPNSDPPCHEFLWGPRAYAKTSKMKVLEFLAKLKDTVPSAFMPHYEEALRDEEERAQALAQAVPRDGTPSKDSAPSRATSSCCPHPE